MEERWLGQENFWGIFYSALVHHFYHLSLSIFWPESESFCRPNWFSCCQLLSVLETVSMTKVLANKSWENISKPLNAVKNYWDHYNILMINPKRHAFSLVLVLVGFKKICWCFDSYITALSSDWIETCTSVKKVFTDVLCLWGGIEEVKGTRHWTEQSKTELNDIANFIMT